MFMLIVLQIKQRDYSFVKKYVVNVINKKIKKKKTHQK